MSSQLQWKTFTSLPSRGRDMLDSAMIDGHAGLHLTHLATPCLGCGVCLPSAKWQEDMNFIFCSHESPAVDSLPGTKLCLTLSLCWFSGIISSLTASPWCPCVITAEVCEEIPFNWLGGCDCGLAWARLANGGDFGTELWPCSADHLLCIHFLFSPPLPPPHSLNELIGRTYPSFLHLLTYSTLNWCLKC